MEPEVIELKSGRWLSSMAVTAGGAVLELAQPWEAGSKMRVPLPLDWRALSPDEVRDLARRPEVRLWCDSERVLWRVSVVGPGTPYPYPLRQRHLVFDSERAFAGIVEFPPTAELGDLTALELQSLRDCIADFGGRRRGYRPPSAVGI